MAAKKMCEIEHCDNTQNAHGLCGKHYMRWRRYGDTSTRKYYRNNPEASFEARTQWEPMSGCLIWTGSTDSNGYGRIQVNKKGCRASRYAWERVNGKIPNGLHVLHRCDVRCCVNVNHLFLGTHMENMADMAAKGRCNPPKGEDNGNSKLTKKQVQSILGDNRTNLKIAINYGVSPVTVAQIKRRETWVHVKTKEDNSNVIGK